MTQDEIRDRLTSIGLVKEINVSTRAAAAFQNDLGAATVAAVTLFLTSLGKAVAGRLADMSWPLIGDWFRAQRRRKGRVAAVYRSKIRRTEVELMVEYPDVKSLRKDLKNHRVYVSLAVGYTLARLPPRNEAVSLLDALPEESLSRPRRLVLRRA